MFASQSARRTGRNVYLRRVLQYCWRYTTISQPKTTRADVARKQPDAIGLVVPRYRAFPPFFRTYFPTGLDGVVVAAESHGFFVKILLDTEETTAEYLGQLVVEKAVDGLLFTVSLAEYTRFKNGQDRLEVFTSLSREFEIESMFVAGDVSRTSGYNGSHRLLSSTSPPTLIMTAADRAALGVLRYCDEHEIAVPAKLRLIGYDKLHTAADATPPLTTVRNPTERSGYIAPELRLDFIETHQTTPVQGRLDTELVIRRSTGPVDSSGFPI